jgi:hypothetical protein
MPHKEMLIVHCENHTEHVTTVCGKMQLLLLILSVNILTSCTNSNHKNLKGLRVTCKDEDTTEFTEFCTPYSELEADNFCYNTPPWIIAEMPEGQTTRSRIYMMNRWDASIQRVIAPAHKADKHYSNKQQDSLSKRARKENHTARRNVPWDMKTKSFKNIVRNYLKRNLNWTETAISLHNISASENAD